MPQAGSRISWLDNRTNNIRYCQDALFVEAWRAFLIPGKSPSIGQHSNKAEMRMFYNYCESRTNTVHINCPIENLGEWFKH